MMYLLNKEGCGVFLSRSGTKIHHFSSFIEKMQHSPTLIIPEKIKWLKQ